MTPALTCIVTILMMGSDLFLQEGIQKKLDSERLKYSWEGVPLADGSGTKLGEHYDVILLDQGRNGDRQTSNEIRRVAVRFPQARILVIGEDVKQVQTTMFFSAGALGVVDKTNGSLHDVYRGVVHLTKTDAPKRFVGQSILPSVITPSRSTGLTEREEAVLKELARGRAAKQIALSLGITERTVRFHLENAKSKLGARNLFELGVRAAQLVE